MSDEFDEISAFPIRQDITVLPADDPKKLRLDWVIYEIGPGETIKSMCEKRLSKEEFEKWEYETNCQRGQETNIADTYSRDGKHVEPNSGHVWSVISCLEFLQGQPWNNLALNYVRSLRPSIIRVAGPNDSVRADAVTWRVTVILDDKRNIRKIEQEVELGTIGVREGGYELRKQLNYQKEHGNLYGYVQDQGPIVIINDYAIQNIDIT